MVTELHTHRFRVMGGPGEIQLFVDNPKQFSKITASLVAEALRIEAKFSRFKNDSIISKINNAAGRDFITVDDETAQLINYGAACFSESRGGFDITSGVLRKVWDFKQARIPTQDEIERVRKLIGWGKVLWNSPRIKLPAVGMEIDLGGIAKEYAVDRICALAQSLGIKVGLVNLAGDLRAFGFRPDGASWKIGIRHPREERQVIATVDLKSGGLATSGDYERFFERDDKRYCHIIDPRTGAPVQGSFRSVTVFAEACLVAGSASTIAMILGESAGRAFLSDLGVPYLTVNSDGSIFSSQLTSSLC